MKINSRAFDAETIDGEPYTLQFGGPSGAELFPVSRSTILETFLSFLARHGDPNAVNVLWAHHLEFDIGVTFIGHPEIWDLRTAHLRGKVDDVGFIEAVFHHAT